MPAAKKKKADTRPISRRELKVVRIGRRRALWTDSYARLLDTDWGKLGSVIGIVYFFVNLVFAGLYLELGSIASARTDSEIDSFQDAFFFSVQTMATIGYGKLIPVGLVTNLLVTVEALFGFVFFATVTGMAFAKLSRPTARVLFSNLAVVGPFDGKPHLMVRLANERGNKIVDGQVQLFLLMDVETQEGGRMRRFHDLALVRDKVPVLQYTWTLMHPIEKGGLLFDLSPEKLRAMKAEIIVSLSGIDETYAQAVHARHSYAASEILCNAVFEDVLKRDDNSIEINFDKFHQTRSLEKPGVA